MGTGTVKDAAAGAAAAAVAKPQARADGPVGQRDAKQFNGALNQAKDASSTQSSSNTPNSKHSQDTSNAQDETGRDSEWPPSGDPNLKLENNAWTYTDENGQIWNYVNVSGEDKVPTGRQTEVVVGHEPKVVGVRIYPGPIPVPVPVIKDEPVVVRRPEIKTKPWHAEGWVKDRGEVIEVKGSVPKKEKSTFENVTRLRRGRSQIRCEVGAWRQICSRSLSDL